MLNYSVSHLTAMTKELDKLLLEAAENGDLEGVKKALEKGAEVNAKTAVNGTALIFASYEGHLEVVKILLEKGADPTIALTAERDEGKTALSFALAHGHMEIAKLLKRD